MDRPLDAAFLKHRTRRRAWTAAAVVALAWAGLAWGSALLQPSVSRSRIRTARVDSGPLESVITAAGTVLPEVEQVVSSPVDARVVRILKRPGDVLAPGDPILEMDLSASVLALQKLDQDLALKRNQQAKTRLDLEARLNELGTQLEIKRLQLESLRSQLARSRQLSEAGLLSRETLSQAELAEAQAAVELKKLETDIRHARASTDTQIQGLGLEMATLRGERDQAQRQLDLATTRADRQGVLTWTVVEEGTSVRRGDVIARVADLASFRVDANVSDVHAQRLSRGLPAMVRINENEVLEGVVSKIDPTIRQGVMTFTVNLKDKASPLLRSNLRVDVLVVAGRKERTLRIKRGPFADGEGTREVFVVRGDRAARTPVRFGLSSYDRLEVLDGMQEGDEAIISDMTDYMHVREVGLR